VEDNNVIEIIGTPVNNGIDDINNVVTAAFETLEASVEEVGSEVTPLVVKLTSELASNESTNDMPLFSPSEQLLFSRQASKAFMPDNFEEDEDDAIDSDESLDEEEYFSDDVYGQYQNKEHDLPTQIKKSPFSKQEDDSFNKQHNKHNMFDKSTGASTNANVSMGNCQCACDGWAEVYIRRPTSNFSWIMKTSNTDMSNITQLTDLSALAFHLEGEQLTQKIDMFLEPMFEWSKKMGSVQTNEKESSGATSDVRSIRSVSDSSSSILKFLPKRVVGPKRRHSTGAISDTTASQYDFVTFLQKYGAQQSSYKSQDDQAHSDKIAAFKTTSNPVYNHPESHIVTRVNHQPVDDKAFTEEETNERRQDKLLQKYLCPSLIFLQLFYSASGSKFDHPAVLVEQSEIVDRAIKILDRFPCVNTHKFGVLYVAYGQRNNEQQILSNEFGSPRYTDFLSGLGELVNLVECIPTDVFTGGLDRNGDDGKFAYIWKDETTHVAFHVATLMPNKETDKQCISKKLHIGNDFITIIYDDSKHGYTYGTIKGQFNLAEIIIKPLEYSSNKVIVRKKTVEGGVTNAQPYIISDGNLPMLVRKLAIHTNMAVVTELSGKTSTNAFASNWLERLRQIKSIRSKAAGADVPTTDHCMGYDFTKYT